MDKSILKACHHSDYFYEIQCQDLNSINALMLPHTPTFDCLFRHANSNQKYELVAIATQIVNSYENMAELCADNTLPEATRQWFQACIPIEQNFDLTRLSWPIIIPINNKERAMCPHAVFRLYNGLHRLIVYSTLVLRNKQSETPINCLLIGPRREGWDRLKLELVQDQINPLRRSIF